MAEIDETEAPVEYDENGHLPGDMAEYGIQQFIEKRARAFSREEATEAHRAEQESKQRFLSKRERENRDRWLAYHERMREVHRDLARRHSNEVMRLIDGDHSANT